MKQQICRTCKETFMDKVYNMGYIDQCDGCSSNDIERYIGRRNGKHGDTEIFRTDIKTVKTTLKRENVVGFNANLPVDIPTNPFISAGSKVSDVPISIKIKENKEPK